MDLTIVVGERIYSPIKPWRIFDNFSSYMFNFIEIYNGNEKYYKSVLSEIMEKGFKIWIDSGGFQIMKKNIKIQIESLARMYSRIEADYFVSLDIPPSPSDNREIREKKIKKSFNNYLFLISRLKDLEDKIIPVVHFSPYQDQFLKQFELYEEFNPDSIAIGGLVPYILTSKNTKNSRKLGFLSLLVSLRVTKSKIHVMGMGAPSILPLLSELGVSSTDSSTWRVKSAFGKIFFPCLGERHITNRDINFGKKKLSEAEWNWIREYIYHRDGVLLKNLGKDEDLLNLLKSDFKSRAIFNLWALSMINSIQCPTRRKNYLETFIEKHKQASLEELLEVWNNIA